MLESLGSLQDVLQRTRAEVARVIIGQDSVVDQALIVIFTSQHALVEGVPGIAKTLLVRTLARVLGCEFNRIQFTPDLMPSDIIGTNVFDMRENRFTLVRGPVFTSFLLGDEINRAPAKTQSALLQAMQERRVTIDRETLPLPADFTVFATQNPVEYEGTYPLPEAQKDRFMMKIIMETPERAEELALAQRMLAGDSPERTLEGGAVQPVLGPGELAAARAQLQAVTVKPALLEHMVDLVRRTRTHHGILVGAGPRATQSFLLGSRAQAAIAGRDFVTPDDIQALAVPILEHRLVLRPEYEIEGLTPREVIGQILQEVTVPR